MAQTQPPKLSPTTGVAVLKSVKMERLTADRDIITAWNTLVDYVVRLEARVTALEP